MEKQKTRYRLDKKTGHLLEIPSKKQVRENVKKIREQKGKDQLPQSPVTIHETQADKSNYTTIQEVRLRPWFFLHRYWYEISFDGRVEPAMMLNDYNLNPTLSKKHFYVTREYVKVRNQDAENDYFRFWLHKPTDHEANK